MAHAIVWFRRDLRLDDHPALSAALRAGYCPIPIYIHSPEERAPWMPGEASLWWLHHSLEALSSALQGRGSRLVLRCGPSLPALQKLVIEARAEAVFWHRLYEPAEVERDRQVKAALAAQGIRCESHNGALLIEPWQVETRQGDPYKVFTPFWKNARPQVGVHVLPELPPRLPTPPDDVESLPLKALRLLPKVRWDAGLAEAWRPGEAGASARLDAFLTGGIGDYRDGRDRPDRDGTSRLSPHLHFGEISPRRILQAIEARKPASADAVDDSEAYVRELGWREFSHHLIYHFPHTPEQPLNARFEHFAWRRSGADLAAWQRGRTGIPIVDAGMRQLWRTGWMHNRVRMIVASLLTKNLRLHWLDGARWFWDTLVDADLANNTQGWQWTAGSGADAAPYFRIFNPVAQGERFDPDGDYVGAWVVELAGVPAAWRHRPWQAPADVLHRAGLAPDSIYRQPIVDLAASRAAALEAYAQMKVGAKD